MKIEDIEFVNYWRKKLKDWKRKEKQWEKLEETISGQKEKLERLLKDRFKLFSHEDYNLSRVYRNSSIGKELNILLRSGMKRKKNIRIDNVTMYSWHGYDHGYVSENYGLKVPHGRYSYDPLDKIDDASYTSEITNNIFTIIQDKETKEERITCRIDFRQLLNPSIFKSEKFEKYIEFLQRGIELRTLEFKIKKIPISLENKIDLVNELSDYNIFDSGRTILNNLEKLDEAQERHKKKTALFFESKKKLQLDLEEVNKPYKIFKKLSK